MKVKLAILLSGLMFVVSGCSGGGGTTSTSSSTATGMALPAQVSAVTATN